MKYAICAIASLIFASFAQAALVSVPLTPLPGASATPAHGSNLLNTTSDPFAYNPDSWESPLPSTGWNGATHFHAGENDPQMFWSLDEITWVNGSQLFFDFYGRTGCCPTRDNNYDIVLLDGGVTGTEVYASDGNNAPDGGSNRLRTDMSIGLTAGDKFDTIRIDGNNFNFTIAEVRVAAEILPEPSTSMALAGLAAFGLVLRRRR